MSIYFQQSNFGLCCEPVVHLVLSFERSVVEGALLDSLNIFQQMWISKESSEQHDFYPRGPVDALSEDFLPHWMRRQVRLHGRRDHSYWCLRVLHRGTNAQRGWWLRVKGQMLDSDRGVVPVR